MYRKHITCASFAFRRKSFCLLLRASILTLASILAMALSLAGFAQADYTQRQDVQAYIEQLVTEHKVDREQALRAFKKVEKQKRALDIMDRPAEAKPWYQYRQLFVTPQRIARGASFWIKHRSLLEDIQKKYAVPTEVLLAIIGVETFYGNNLGNFRVFDVLVTLGFDHPRRAAFFRKELTNFFLLLQEEAYQDPFAIKGSYAGAMGIGQFIPSSYRAYAIDFDNDGKRDLWKSLPDSLASVANYLIRHGWQVDQMIVEPVVVVAPTDRLKQIANHKFLPSLGEQDAADLGVVTTAGMLKGMKYAMFAFKVKPDFQQYWAGYKNFYAITRYNHSRRYAMAVYQLSEAIQQRYKIETGKI